MVLIVILSLFGPLSTDMYRSGLPVMVKEFGTNETVMNITLYAFMLSMAVSTLFLGPISDKYGRRKTLLATMAIYIVSSFACCIAPDVWTLIALRIVQAVGGGGAMCISIALIKDFFNGREMARVLSITSALDILSISDIEKISCFIRRHCGPSMDPACTVYKTMDYLSKKWTVLILLELSKGGEWKRFSELKTSMKEITPKVLSERLKELEAEGLIEHRVDTSEFPIRSEYRLTECSLELIDIVRDIKMWALKWKIDNEPCKLQNCRLCTL